MTMVSRSRGVLMLCTLCTLCMNGCVRAGFDSRDGGDLPRREGGTADLPAVDLFQPSDLPGPLDLALDGPALRSGAIVPLYVDPPHAAWTALAKAKMAYPKVPVVAVVNVNNGPGNSSKSAFAQGIFGLSMAKVRVVGYLWTNYGKRAAAEVKTEIDRWKSWYGPHGLSGIFLDGQATKAGLESYYKDLTAYAKSKGLSFAVGDPGTDPAQGYVGAVDTMLIYQGAGLPTLASLGGWHTKHDKMNFGIVAYGVPKLSADFVASARKLVGYIYLTDDSLPDPWDDLSTYFGGLLAALDK